MSIYAYGDGGCKHNRPNRRILRTKEVSTMYRSSTTSYPLCPILCSVNNAIL